MGPPSFRPLAGRADSRVLRGRPARWVGSPRFRRDVASAASLAPRCRLAGVLRVGWVRRSFAALPPAPPRGLLVGAPCAGRVRKGLAALPPAPRRGSLISFTSFPSRFVASCLVWIPIAPSWSSLEGRLAGPPPILPHPPWEPQRSLPLFLLGSFTLSSSRSFRFRAPPLGIFVGPLRPSGGHPGLSWSPLGTSWSSLDGLLGHLGATLEVLEALLERCEPREVWKRTVLNPVSMRMSDVAFMWPSWGHLGALLGRHRGLLSRIGAILMSWSAFGLSWTPLGPCWALLQGLLARLVASGRWKRHTGNPRARKSAPEI